MFLILKLINFVIYVVSIFLEYFTKCWLSIARFYLLNILNQLVAIGSKRKSGVLCNCRMLSQTSINVNWDIQQVSMLYKPNMSSQIWCTKVCLNGYSNILELVQWSFLSWGTQENLSPSCFPYGQWSSALWGISKGECCGALFYSQCNKLETAMRFGSYCIWQKEI